MKALPRGLDVTLKLEWAGVAVGALVAYHLIGGSWLLFAVLVLAPDLSMLGYYTGPRVGAICYNAVHTLIGPLLLGAAAYFSADHTLWSLTLIWAFHIAFDRMMGYGLKLSTVFRDTHLGTIGRDAPQTTRISP